MWVYFFLFYFFFWGGLADVDIFYRSSLLVYPSLIFAKFTLVQRCTNVIQIIVFAGQPVLLLKYLYIDFHAVYFNLPATSLQCGLYNYVHSIHHIYSNNGLSRSGKYNLFGHRSIEVMQNQKTVTAYF